MPPKGKKKKTHAPPEVHPHILKRREADRIKAQKLYVRGLKKMKKNRKLNNETTVSSANSEANFSGSFRCGTNGEESELQGNNNFPESSRNESGASKAGKLQVEQETCIGKINKTGKDTATVQKKSLAESQPEVPKIPEAGKKHFRGNVIETGLDHSKGVPIRSLGDKKVPKISSQIQTTTRGKKSVAMTTEKESPKSQGPIKSAECKIDSSNRVPPKSRKKLSENLLRKKEKLQMKLQTFESELKCLDEPKKNLLPITGLKVPEMAVIGDIKMRKSNKSGRKNEEKIETFAYYDTDKRLLRIGDEDVEIFILVRQGIQVICKSNRFNAESISPRPESRAKIHLEKDAVSGSDHHEKSTTDTKCTSSNIYESSNQEYHTLENQTIVRSEKDEKHHLEPQVEAIMDAECTATSVSKHSGENSELSSVQENIKNFCDEFLKDFIATCESFEAKVMKCIEDKQS